MNRFALYGCLACLVVVSGLVADEEKKDEGDGQPEMVQPPVPPEMEQLANWVGEWKATFEGMGPEPSEGTYVVRKALKGMAYVGDFAMTDFEGHSVYTYDPKGKKWHMFWFDSMVPGHGADWVGEFRDGTLTVEATEDMGQGPVPMRIVETWDGKDKVTFKMEAKQGEQWGTMMQGTYTRTK